MLLLKKLYCLLFTIAIGLAGANAQTCIIKGCVNDNSHAPMAGVNIILLTPSDSSIVLGSITSLDGHFEVKAAAQKKYILSLSMIGYKKQFFDITAKAKEPIDIGTVTLSEDAMMLSGATIQGKKSAIEFEAGKTIVNPNASIVTSQGNILDVLKNIPGLIVNEDGTIILNGQKGVTVQVNGKTSYLSGPALVNQLQSLSASSVDQVEVITNPTAQYDASGKAGVINIKVQKKQILGQSFSANLNARQGQRAYSDVWARGTVQKEKVGYFAEYFKAYGNRGHHNNVIGTSDGTYKAPNTEGKPAADEYILETPHYLETLYKDASNMVKFGGDATLSKKLTMNAYVSGNFYRRHVPGLSIGSYAKQGQKFDSTQYTNNHSFMRQNTLNAGIGLDYRDDKSRTADISVDLLKYTHDESLSRYSSMVSHIYHTERLDTLLGDLNSDIRMVAVQGNYSMPLAKFMKFESGIKVSYVDIDNAAMYRNPIEGADVPNYGLSSKYLYTENNNAAYMQVNGKTKHISFNLGLRAENSRIDGKTCAVGSSDIDSSYKIRYTELFPTVVIQYNCNENSNFALTYNRRITRPNYRELSPFNQMWDEYTISKGNPKLRAEFTDNVDLSYTFLRAFRFSLQASNTDRAMSQCFNRLSNGGVLIYPDNMGSSRTFGAKAEAGRFISSRWLQVALSTSLYQTKNKWVEFGEGRTLRQTTFNCGVNSQFIFGKGWSGQISGYYNSDMAYGQILVTAFGTVSAGLQKNLWDNRATVRLVVNDIFSTMHQTIVFRSYNIVGRSRQRDDDTYVGISISCNLKSGTLKDKKNNERTIEESKRINL